MWLLPLALAQGDVDLEVLVEAQRTEAAARAALEDEILEMGYTRGFRVGQREVFFPYQPWKPRVAIHDEGFLLVNAIPVVPMVPLGAPPPVARDYPGIEGEPRGLERSATPGVSGVWMTPREAKLAEGRVVQALHPGLTEWREAMWDRAAVERDFELEAELTQLWEEQGLEPTRAALLAMWLDTADSPEGEQVRRHVESFFAEKVQPVQPLGADEVAALNEARGFPRPWRPEALGEPFYLLEGGGAAPEQED